MFGIEFDSNQKKITDIEYALLMVAGIKRKEMTLGLGCIVFLNYNVLYL